MKKSYLDEKIEKLLNKLNLPYTDFNYEIVYETLKDIARDQRYKSANNVIDCKFYGKLGEYFLRDDVTKTIIRSYLV